MEDPKIKEIAAKHKNCRPGSDPVPHSEKCGLNPQVCDMGIKPGSPALQADFFFPPPSELPGNPGLK